MIVTVRLTILKSGIDQRLDEVSFHNEIDYNLLNMQDRLCIAYLARL